VGRPCLILPGRTSGVDSLGKEIGHIGIGNQPGEVLYMVGIGIEAICE
jgi:hypothetical protein